MSATDNVLWFLEDGATMALAATAILGFLLVWALAAILARQRGSGASGIFETEARGFRSWAMAFACHAVIILLVGAAIFIFTDSRWIVLIPCLVVIAIDTVLVALFVDRANTMTKAHR